MTLQPIADQTIGEVNLKSEAAKRLADVDALLDYWRRQARRVYEEERDRISGEFTLAGRSQSAYHIRALAEAAERSVAALLANSRGLPIPAECYEIVRRAGSDLFDDLATDVEAVVVGVNGRVPKPENRTLAVEFIGGARTRMELTIAAWTLEDRLRLAAVAGSLTRDHETSTRAPAYKEGPPPSDGRIIAKADEMRLRGLTTYDIAKHMRKEPGFADVATTMVRGLIKGRWPRGRKKKSAS